MTQCPFYNPKQKVCKACIESEKIGFIANPIGLYQWHRDCEHHYCTESFNSCCVYRKSKRKGWKPEIEKLWSVS